VEGIRNSLFRILWKREKKNKRERTGKGWSEDYKGKKEERLEEITVLVSVILDWKKEAVSTINVDGTEKEERGIL